MSSPAADCPDEEVVEIGWAAASYHRISSFGHFVEPPPPFSVGDSGGTAGQATRPSGLASSLELALTGRCSSRGFGTEPLLPEHVDTVLRAAYGRISGPDEDERRTVPSAGALYPLHIVVAVQAVRGLARGVYRWRPGDGALVALQNVELPRRLDAWFRTHHVDWARAAALVFLIGDLLRTCPKYGERGYRYLLLEAGHVAQNLCLAATALDLPHVPVGGFDNDVVNDALGLDPPARVAVYSVVLGCTEARPR
jgi:SagB-type dehydrogenase family enzyme